MSPFLQRWWKTLLLAIVLLGTYWVATHVKHSHPYPGPSVPVQSNTLTVKGPGTATQP